MSADLGTVIAAVLAGAGEGLAVLRDGGTALQVTDCRIEVLIDGPEPSAQLRLTLGEPEPSEP